MAVASTDRFSLFQESLMKRLVLFASVFALAACSAKEQAPAADSAAAAAPAPAPAMDSAAMAAPAMPNDSTHSGMQMDSAAAPADTAKKM
jgi:uncharacterized lipoprotein YajG